MISQIRRRFSHDSPPSFAALVLHKESRCPEHSYAERCWIALDSFAWRNSNPRHVLTYICEEIDLGKLD